MQQHNIGAVPGPVTPAPFDGVAEAWFPDMAAVGRVMGSDGWANVEMKDDPNFLERFQNAGDVFGGEGRLQGLICENNGRSECARRRNGCEGFKDAALGNRAVAAFPDHQFQFPAQRRQIGQLTLHLCKMLAGNHVHGLARLLFLVGHIEQRPDLLNQNRGRARAA